MTRGRGRALSNGVMRLYGKYTQYRAWFST